MKVKTAIKKIEKYLGVKVTNERGRFTFYYEDEVGSFLPNGQSGDSPNVMEADACNWHRRSSNDHSDSQSDYFAGSFRDNVTQLLHSMKAPPAKYPAGTLVRGKQNKRATRWGFAGKTGLVIKTAGGNATVLWAGEKLDTLRQNNYYSERDLEVVK
jgi:hypothetical protein